jgi:hypothetical protein
VVSRDTGVAIQEDLLVRICFQAKNNSLALVKIESKNIILLMISMFKALEENLVENQHVAVCYATCIVTCSISLSKLNFFFFRLSLDLHRR